MAFITKPNFVQPKTKILADDINKIIQGLHDTENYLENLLGLVTDHIEYGEIENISTSTRGLKTFNITFTKQFTNLPRVFLSMENLDTGVDIKPLWITNLSNSSFTLNVFVVIPRPNTYINVGWLAIL